MNQKTVKKTGTLLWVHEDMLDPKHPIYHEPHDQAIGIFDTHHMQNAGYSLKRSVFIYECFYACPIELYEGESFTVISEILSTNSFHTLLTAPSPSPTIQKTLDQLQELIEINLIAEQAFAGNPKATLTPRFMKYWWQVRRNVLEEPK